MINKYYHNCLNVFTEFNYSTKILLYLTISDTPSTCKSGKWKCTEKKCPGTCVIYGSGHYSTFDQRSYAFQGHCGYVAMKVNNPCHHYPNVCA